VPQDPQRRTRHPEAQPAEAARVGEELRACRMAMGISLEEMAARLRIRLPLLQALEEGRVADLPAPAYAVGFVRAYAMALGLDADEMVRRFRDLSGPAVTRKTNLVFPEAVPERGVPTGAVIALGVVLSFGAYVAWFNWSGSGSRVVDAVPPVPARLEAAVEQGRAQMPREVARTEGLPAAALPPPGGAPAGGAGANTAAQAATVPAPQPAATPAPAAAPAAEARVLVRVRNAPEGAWVQVRDPATRQVLLNRVLRPGESWPVPARDGLQLDTGKAENLEILLEGQAAPVLAGAVGVRRNLPLDPDRLRQLAAAQRSQATGSN
jgi:cytoskeleton protein RodZ